MQVAPPKQHAGQRSATSRQLARLVWQLWRLRGIVAISLLWLAVLMVYCPSRLLSGQYTLMGGDYLDLHQHRIRFAQAAIFGPQPHLPAWYPRELLGTPFWSNVQSFPFIPTRLILLPFDYIWASVISVNLAALLAATFTYLYCRRVGLGRIGAMAAGWTFACSGYFASRVMVGHLPLLEGYPALPLLLWLIEWLLQSPEDQRFGVKLLAPALAAACVILAGHPQLPIYALGTAGLYLLYRARNRRGLTIALAIGLGIGATGIVLWPMLQLISRSTRILPLDAPDNNVFFPYWRLGSLLFPWKDGWPGCITGGVPKPFAGPTADCSLVYFWDTVCYVGWMPLIASLFLLARATWRRDSQRGARQGMFIAIVGGMALLLALPALQHLLARIPGTILRSPSRQLYLTTFALAMALGTAINLLISSRKFRLWVLGGLCLLIHFIDLSRHDQHFIHPYIPGSAEAGQTRRVAAYAGDGRVAIDIADHMPANRDFDDVGFFDSIMLARPYGALMDMSAAPPKFNTQVYDGSQFNARTLVYAGVRLVIARKPRSDLPLSRRSQNMSGPEHWYTVPNAAERAQFIPSARAIFLDQTEIHHRLRDQQADIQSTIMLAREARPNSANALETSAWQGAVSYQRPSSDQIDLQVVSNQPGFVRIIEAWDSGWQAKLDGQAASILPADDCVMAISLPSGTHQVHLTYKTPGVKMGTAISLLSLAMLALLVVSNKRARPGHHNAADQQRLAAPGPSVN